MKKLKEIIDYDLDIDIYGVTDDSRSVSDGYLFVATKGYNVDHFDFIEDAIKRGCSFVICDRDISYDIPYLKIDNVNEVFRKCCLKFNNLNLEEFKFIGVTGTDGKTTTTTILKNILDEFAYIGTNGLIINDDIKVTDNTTPCVSELYSYLKDIDNQKCSEVVMEVSSEALLHERVNDLKFDIVGITNITGDHLNVHGSFENYLNCKLKLLSLVKDNGYIVVNGDDDSLQNIKCQNVSTFGFLECNDYVIRDVNYGDDFTDIYLSNNLENFHIKSPYLGKYNVYNVVMAFIIGLKYGVSSDVLIKRIENLKPIKGRCEFLDFGQNYKIVLDYAHTINGIKNILNTFNDSKRLITITGAAGGRDREKRNIIGNMVMDKSDIAIFTMDDPRFEDVNLIIDEMVGKRKDYVRFQDREEAIFYALSIAEEDDIVLILGKGRDNYMAIGDKKIKYNDYDVVEKYFLNNN